MIKSVGTNSYLEQQFDRYRVLVEAASSETHGIEPPGILTSESYASALDDDRTVIAQVDGVEVPLVTHHRNTGWGLTPNYWGQRVDDPGVNDDEIYCVTFPPGNGTLKTPHDSRLKRLTGGLLLTDCLFGAPQQLQHRNLATFFMAHGIGLEAMQVPGGYRPQHFHYESLVGLPVGTPDDTETPAIVALAEREGEVCSKDGVEAQIQTQLNGPDVEQVVGYYGLAHRRIMDDPIIPFFSDPEIRHILTDPLVIKSVARRGNTILNVCLITDARDTVLANQTYMSVKHPERLDLGKVLFSFGVFNNTTPEAREVQPRLASQVTMGLIGDRLRETRQETTISFICNRVSARYVPRLSQLALTSSRLSCSYEQAVSSQDFRLLRLTAP